jgi:hypothetical protein
MSGQKEYTETEVRLIIEGAVREEREACAKLCEEMASWHCDLVMAAYEYAAEAIRARNDDAA